MKDLYLLRSINISMFTVYVFFTIFVFINEIVKHVDTYKIVNKLSKTKDIEKINNLDFPIWLLPGYFYCLRFITLNVKGMPRIIPTLGLGIHIALSIIYITNATYILNKGVLYKGKIIRWEQIESYKWTEVISFINRKSVLIEYYNKKEKLKQLRIKVKEGQVETISKIIKDSVKKE